jgi:hypothetical protein
MAGQNSDKIATKHRPHVNLFTCGRAGAVRLVGARLGRLECDGVTMRNDSGPALTAFGLQVDQNVLLHGGFEAVGAGSDMTLNLSGARIGGVLEFAPTRLEHTDGPQARLTLDGLTHAGLPAGISSRDWLRLLREATPSYAAQPYQQFAGAHRAAASTSRTRRSPAPPRAPPRSQAGAMHHGRSDSGTDPGNEHRPGRADVHEQYRRHPNSTSTSRSTAAASSPAPTTLTDLRPSAKGPFLAPW